jgi:hypothetical protein
LLLRLARWAFAASVAAAPSYVVRWRSGLIPPRSSVHGFVDSPYWKNDMSVEFWILVALQVVTLRVARRN